MGRTAIKVVEARVPVDADLLAQAPDTAILVYQGILSRMARQCVSCI
jgi:hypothetical protein